MTDIIQVMAITVPIFLIIFIGYVAVKSGRLPANSSQVLSAFAINLALPAMLFRSISQKPLAEFYNAEYLLAYAAGSLATFFLVYNISRRMRGHGITQSAIYGMGSSFSNSLMIGFPLLIQLFGDVALVPLALTLMVESFVMLPLILMLADSGVKSEQSKARVLARSFSQVLGNPIILAIFCGVLVSGLNIPLPQIVLKVVDLFAVTVAGVALVAIGGLLVGLKVGNMMQDIRLILPSKLLLHPLLVLVAMLSLTQLDQATIAMAVLLASMPMLGVYPIIAQKYHLGSNAAAALVPTTVLSFFSLSLVIWLIGQYASLA